MTTVQVQEQPVRNAPLVHSTVMTVLFAISFSHLLNDTIQALLPSIYPMLRDSFHLNFAQLGWITFTFQCTASLFQPLVGLVTDKRPMPHSLAAGMGLTLVGLLSLAFADSYVLIIISAAVIGLGSAIFHPEASRVAHMAAGTRRGFAQSFFQLGGNAGSALGPLLAALIVVSRGQKYVACFSLLALAVITAVYLPPKFQFYLLLYFVTTLAYSLSLKRIVLVDVIILSSLYTIRMMAGSAATHDPVSPWLAAFSIFLFLSLAMVKRFSELQNLITRGVNPTNGRGYLLSDVEQLRSFGTSSAYASIVIFALYINGRDVVALYHHPNRMWLITPLLILWISRVWLLASRGLLNEDPVVFALSDRMSLLLGLGVAAIAYSAL